MIYKIRKNLGQLKYLLVAANKGALNSILSGEVDDIKDNKYVTAVLFGMPKSASLYTTEVIKTAFDYKRIVIGPDNRNGEIYYPNLLKAKIKSMHTISHCHNSPTPYIMKVIGALQIKPIITYRNLLDVIVSRRDMLLKDKWAGPLLSEYSMRKFLDSDEEYQFDMIIELFVNDYLNFFVGWKKAASERNYLVLNYSSLIDDSVGYFKEIGKYLAKNTTPDIESIKLAIRYYDSRGGVNFNVGKRGRGLQKLSDNNIKKVSKKAKLFNCYDSEFLGFDHNEI